MTLSDHARIGAMLKHRDKIKEFDGLMQERLDYFISEKDQVAAEINAAEIDLVQREQDALKTTTLKLARVKLALSAWTVKVYECITQTFSKERKRLSEVRSLLTSPESDFESLRSCAKTLTLERSLLSQVDEEAERLTHILTKLTKSMQVEELPKVLKSNSLNHAKASAVSKLNSLPCTPKANSLDISWQSPFQFTSKVSKGRLTVRDLRSDQRFTYESDIIETGSRVSALDNFILLMTGGFKQPQACIKVNVCDGITQPQALMQIGRYNHSSVTLEAGVLVAGGYNRGALRSVEIWEHGIWRTLCSMLFPRYDHSAVLHSENVYVIGGHLNSHDLLDSLEVWNGTMWSLISIKLPVKVQFSCALAINPDELLIVGGKGFDNKHLASTWIFSVSEGSFIGGPSLKFGDEFSTEGIVGVEGVELEGIKGTHTYKPTTEEFGFSSHDWRNAKSSG